MENKAQINKVKNRFLFISPSVAEGLEPEAKITDFDILEKLGEGSFGKVYRAKHKKTGAIYAIKSIDKLNKNNQEGKPYFRREIEIMYKVRHPNIVRLFNHFEDDQNCYFVLEYIPKGNLFTILSKQKTKSFDASTTAHFIRDLICSVYYLHNMDPPIIHRDIKPENVLLNEHNKVKLTDFGWSNYIEDSGVRSTYCGTPVYLAPEMIKESGHDHNLDIWCIGILMFELLTGSIPFQGADQQALSSNILKNKICWPKDIDPSAKDLISKILKTEPSERIQLVDMLKHPFFLRNVDKPTENLFKPNDEGMDDKSIYVLMRDTPQILNKPIIRKKEVIINDAAGSAATSVIGSVSTTVTITDKGNLNQDEKEKLNKLIIEHNKLLKDHNSLKEQYNDLLKKNEDLSLKQNYFNLEKNQLIKERDEIEGQKLEYQKQLAELKQSIFEFENKIRILKNEINIKDNRIQLDNKEIDRLNIEIEELIMAREEERKIFNQKLEIMERKLNFDKRDSKLLGEVNEMRNTLENDEKESDLNALFNEDEKLKREKEELTYRFENLKNELSKEKERFSLLLRNKEEEIKKLASEKSTKKDSESRKFEFISNKYENTVRAKDEEIESLKARIKKLETVINLNEIKL